MKLLAVANGNIVDIPDDEQARALIRTGYYEEVKEQKPKDKRASRSVRHNAG